MRTIKITITNEDCEVLDSTTFELETGPNEPRQIAVRVVTLSKGPRPDEEILDIGASKR